MKTKRDEKDLKSPNKDSKKIGRGKPISQNLQFLFLISNTKNIRYFFTASSHCPLSPYWVNLSKSGWMDGVFQGQAGLL